MSEITSYLNSLALRRAMIAVLALVSCAWFAAPAQAQQAAYGEGVLGWYTPQAPYLTAPGVYRVSAGDACHAQWTSFQGSAPASRFIGAESTQNPYIYVCAWTDSHWGCSAGLTACGYVLPGIVEFVCAAGYHKAGHDRCERNEEETPPNTTPCVGNPAAIFDGSKMEDVTDYATGDGKFIVGRVYRSLPAMSSFRSVWDPPNIAYIQANNGIIRGAIGGWRFNFQTELHFSSNDASGITLHLPNGVGFDFARSGDSFAPIAGTNLQTRYSLQFVGAPPANWTSVASASTQWRLTDADDRRVWTFQTFNAINRAGVTANYNIARPIQMKTAGGYVWNFTYDVNGTLQSIGDSYGRTFTVTWNKFIFPETTFPNTTPLPISIKEIGLPGGGKLRYAYDPPLLASGTSLQTIRRLVKQEILDSAGAVLDYTTYQYENTAHPDFLTGMTDGRGVRYATFAYDARGRVVSTEHAGGRDKYTISYNIPSTTLPNELIRYVTNPLGKVAEYHWNHPGNAYQSRLTSIVGEPSANCVGGARAFAYDGAGFTTSETDEEGRVTAYVRDARGRPTSITRGSGTAQASTTTYLWDAVYDIATQTTEPGLLTQQAVNAATGLVALIRKTDTTVHSVPYSTRYQSRSWSYAYNATGQLISVDGPLAGTGDRMLYAYTAAGYLRAITNELGHVTTVTAWNGRGQPTSVTDANGVVTTLAYEPARGLLTQMNVDTAGTPATTTILYNQIGQVTKITLPNGAFETYAYDAARRLTTTANSAGETISYVRDAMGGVTSTTIKRANATIAYSRTRAYDELGRMIRAIGAGAQTYRFGYDKTDNLTSVADPRSAVFSYGFDPLNRLIRETDEGGAVVDLARNGKDEITAYKDPRTIVTTYVRNGFGEIIQEASPDKGTTVYVRDARGLATQKTDPRGIVTTYAYDAAGRLTNKSYAGQSAYWQSFAYDAAQPNAIGRLSGLYSETGLNWRIFDAKGRIATDYRTNTPAPALAVDYSYDAAGNVTEMIYPSGRRVAFARDSLGRVGAVTTRQNGAAAVQSVVSNVTWNPYGPLAGFSSGNGLATSFTLDSDYRITRVRVGSAAAPGSVLDRSLSWTGDMIDRIADNQFPGTTPPFTYTAQTQSFLYTPTRRLASASGYYGVLSWAYDASGNRMRETANGAVSSYAYPLGSNRLTSVTAGATTRSFTYDAAGNVLTDSRGGALAMSFQYDVEGRLSKAWQTGAPLNGGTYGYDAMGRLASKTVTKTTAPLTTTTLYVHDINDHIIAETNTAGVTLREYIWLNDLPVAVVDRADTATPTLYYVHTDHLGRPARMTAQNWAWAWDVIYSPFGAVSAIFDTTAKLDLRFPGQWFQLESGLAYNWHRHYDASLGRYVQPDPIGFEGGKNLFSYVNQNPLAYTDANGLEAIAAMAQSGWGLNPAEGPQVECAWAAFRANFADMSNANTIGADKYFHCKANCEASKCGDYGKRQACVISDAREFTDDYFKDPAKRVLGISNTPVSYSASKKDSLFDQLANRHGRDGAANSCRDTCSIYRPRGLDPKY